MTDTVTTWLADNAHPIDLTDPDLRPLDDLMRQATVVGLGETTRAGVEVLQLGHAVLRHLVRQHGFRGLVLQDDRSVVADLNRWVHGADDDVVKLLEYAWIPWQNTTTIEILTWIRDYNTDHPDDPISLYGLTEPAARADDYDRVLDAITAVDPALAADIREHYAVIRTAHQLGEHVQLARGIHPGRPFVEHARQARHLLDGSTVSESILAVADLIVDFHAYSVAGGYDFTAAATSAATEILRLRQETGQRLVYWEGIAHTSVSHHLVLHSLASTTSSPGGWLRDELGEGYVSVYIGFQQGEIHDGQQVPPPAEDFVDTALSTPQHDTYLVNLHAPAPDEVTRWLRGDHKIRVIAGVYDPADDAEHYINGQDLATMFDAIIRTRAITPTTMLSRRPKPSAAG